MISFLFRRQLCYDISLHSDIELTKEIFPKVKDQRVSLIPPGGDHVLSFGFPEYPIISRQGSELILSEMEWSVDPVYEKDPVERKKKRIRMADMRSERVLEDKRSFWYKLRTNRCLIPVSGTYEHRAIQGWAQKVPYYIWPKDRKIQFLPGLYQLFESIGPAGEKIQIGSFGMLTRSANELMASIHNDGEFRHRMPLFLTPELEQFWVSEDFSEDDMQAVFDYCLPSELLDAHTVFSVRGKKPRPDGKPKFEFWKYENLQPLGNDHSTTSHLNLF
ncbi:SOS response-associated peptidase [Dyadobacter sp. CY261]|uniref:SOS response-associated peptidase n=1 Tax=Dyadobacter sp. CY261 TaxID=2907203 RepID=UPI001F3E3920|nr:SOS response-associated peptidase family protein [Dyadobacter sp. CY261]MCF0075602.1 SOS response-associated peptidase [Dyadobacter sp. CY261]